MTLDVHWSETLFALAANGWIQSTVLLGALALLLAALPRLSPAWEELLWKGALLAALVGALLSPVIGLAPRVEGWLAPTAASSHSLADTAPAATARHPVVHAPDAVGPLRHSAGAPTHSVRSGPGAVARPVSNVSAAQAPALAAATEGSLLNGRPALPHRYVSEAASAAGTGGALPQPVVEAAGLSRAQRVLVVLSGVAALGLLLHWRRGRQLSALLAQRKPVTDPRVMGLLSQLCTRTDSGLPRLTESANLASPVALTGWEICLPRRALQELDEGALNAALAHELAHLRRRDPQWRQALDLAVALVPVQPLFRLARSRLTASSELLCDDWAVTVTGRPRAFAACLAQVASWLRESGAPVQAVAMARSDSALLARVRRVCSGQRVRRPARTAVLALSAALVAVGLSCAPVVGVSNDPAPLKTRFLEWLATLDLPKPTQVVAAGAVAQRANEPSAAPGLSIEVQGELLTATGPVSLHLSGGVPVLLVLGQHQFRLEVEDGALLLQGEGLELVVDDLTLITGGSRPGVVLKLSQQVESLAAVLRNSSPAPRPGVRPEHFALAAPGAAGNDQPDPESGAQLDLDGEFAERSADLERELALLEQELDGLSSELDRSWEAASWELEQQCRSTELELEAQLNEIWEQEHGSDDSAALESQLTELEDHWWSRIDGLHSERDAWLEQADELEEDQQDDWLDDWQDRLDELELQAELALEQAVQQAERNWEKREAQVERAREAAERQHEREQSRVDRSFERQAQQLERRRQQSLQHLERALGDLEQWYERSWYEL